VLDKWLRTKTANLGVDLTFPPLQFGDPNTNTPSGFMIDVTNAMMSDLGVTTNYVEIPFSQLFAAPAAGQFDMMADQILAVNLKAPFFWPSGWRG
jgi:ABC-type amino acid transport substrate-binding protein